MSAIGDITSCPRCEDGTANVIARSPIPAVWEVFHCEKCLYMWRSTEPERRTRRDRYPAEFRMTQADIDTAPEVPTIPPLESGT
ncbi:MAG: non-oxidative hydroxyarylic acid decarboxylases subunit D [Mycolicibacterium sp.]|uniref:non-oxidative hydroxyarylic acid decarboxylases subunit D n=1 Tax=Mycolicibacterium sp. TaxID=2320850 RepID=UPI003D150D25